MKADDLIAFEDALQNRVFVKNIEKDLPDAAPIVSNNTERRKRSISTENVQQDIANAPVDTKFIDSHSNVSSDEADEFEYVVSAVDGENTYMIPGRQHYAQYSIMIIACQEKNNNETKDVWLRDKCSTPNENVITTQPKSKY